MVDQPVRQNARRLEDEFFAAENRNLLDAMRHKARRKEQREVLARTLGSDDEALLDHLIRLGIEPETALALTLVPLVAVAWADSRLELSEREAVVRAAEEQGVKSGTPARDLLDSWLEQPPPPKLIDAWKRYAQVVCADLDEGERGELRDRTVGRARRVAEATGGFLGLTSKVSAAEEKVLADLERALS